MFWKNIFGVFIIIANLAGLILVCIKLMAPKIQSRKKSAPAPVVSSSPVYSLPENDKKLKDQLLKDMDLADLDDLNLDDFD